MLDLATIPQVRLAFAPTPLQDAPRLANAIGLRRLLIKRDDQTGLAMGGNKARKLEFLIADALAQGADSVVTMGGPQSNHCRMTAAAARAHGLKAHLVFNASPVEAIQGNMVLDRLLGASWTFVRPGQSALDRMKEVAAELTAQGRTPYIIPAGGSNGLGVLGYVKAAFELSEQCQTLGAAPDYIVLAAGSYGTQAGLVLGAALAGLRSQVVGVSISTTVADKRARIDSFVRAAAGIIQAAQPDTDPVVWEDYVGDGYGIPTALSTQALELAASTEGLLLDPVYTAKAFSGLMGERQRGRIKPDDLVVFIHTGGTPALFAEQRLYWGRTPPN